MIDSEQLKQHMVKAVEEIRATNPMAGSITNTVTIDFVANAQLAVGGSAAMVYLPDEGEALVAGGGAIYLNRKYLCFALSSRWEMLSPTQLSFK